ALASDLASLRIHQADREPGSFPWRFLLVATLLLGLFTAGYKYGKPYLEASLFKPTVESTEIALISPAQSSIELTSAGYVIPQRVSKVGAKVPGRLAKVLVQEGDQVEAGSVLAVLEDA